LFICVSSLVHPKNCKISI